MKPVALLSVVAMLLLAGCVAPFASNSESSASPVPAQVTDGGVDDGTTVTVAAAGEASAEADLAVVRVSVEATADTADAARGTVAGDAERMRAALRGAGVADDAVTSAGYFLSPEYDHRESDPVPVGYRAVHAYEIEVAPDRAGEVVDVAVGNGADRVDGVRFTLREETRADLRREALTAAMGSARADADAVAAAADLELVGVADVSTDGTPVSPVDVRYAEAGGDAAAATTLEPGPVTVTANVRVTYRAA